MRIFFKKQLLINIVLLMMVFFGFSFNKANAIINFNEARGLLLGIYYSNGEQLPTYNPTMEEIRVFMNSINNYGMTPDQALFQVLSLKQSEVNSSNNDSFNTEQGVWNNTESGWMFTPSSGFRSTIPPEERNIQFLSQEYNIPVNLEINQNQNQQGQSENNSNINGNAGVNNNNGGGSNGNNENQEEIPYLDLESSYSSGGSSNNNEERVNCGQEGLQGVDFLLFHGPLVPCGIDKKCANGNTSINKTCTLCHFIILAKNIFDLILSLLIVVSILMLTIAGVLYIVSAGGSMTTLAKTIIQKTLLGFGIFLLSWLIVYTILNLLSVKEDGMIGKGTADSWFQFTCDTESSFDKDLLKENGTTGGGAGGGWTTGGGASGGGGTGGGNQNVEAPLTSTPEGQARASLFEDSGGNISIWESRTGATNVRDLRPATRQGILNFQREVGSPIIITGGAESGYHADDGSVGYTHENGYKVDIEDTPAVNHYIESHYRPVGYRSGTHGGRVYTDGRGNYYTREDTHWDVCYSCRPDISTSH